MTAPVRWIIWVNGYGAFHFDGTEQKAEGRRGAKACWEGGIGRKWRIGADGKPEPDKMGRLPTEEQMP